MVDRGNEEDELARRLLVDKYSPRYSGDLEDWRRRALVVAVDLRGLTGATSITTPYRAQKRTLP